MPRTMEDLTVGDSVVVIYAHGAFGISQITKVTKTQVTTSNSTRYNKQSCSVIGGNMWDTSYINPELDADEYRTRIKKYQAIRELKKFMESVEVLKLDLAKIDIVEVNSMLAKLKDMVR